VVLMNEHLPNYSHLCSVVGLMSRETALKLYKQSLHDLEKAEKNIANSGYDVSAFLSQQAVEKLLKAIFAFEEKSIPRSHHIDELAQELHVSQEVLNDVLELTVDYTFARYPDVADVVPYEEYTEALAKEKMGRAKNIFAHLKDRVSGLAENPKENE
jgi:HEPN domain-containing protein